MAGRGTPLSVTRSGTAVHVLCPHCPPWDVTVPAHGFPCPKYHKLIDNVCTSISYTNNVICPKSKFSPFLKTAADFTMKEHGTVWEASLSLAPLPSDPSSQPGASTRDASGRWRLGLFQNSLTLDPAFLLRSRGLHSRPGLRSNSLSSTFAFQRGHGKAEEQISSRILFSASTRLSTGVARAAWGP